MRQDMEVKFTSTAISNPLKKKTDSLLRMLNGDVFQRKNTQTVPENLSRFFFYHSSDNLAEDVLQFLEYDDCMVKSFDASSP